MGLANALEMHAHNMGYDLHISEVAVSESLSSGVEDVAVTVVHQSGVAPFYYDLGLELACADLSSSPLSTLPVVESLIAGDDSATLQFTGVPATVGCLSAISLNKLFWCSLAYAAASSQTYLVCPRYRWHSAVKRPIATPYSAHAGYAFSI
jgi:hypothetical protein